MLIQQTPPAPPAVPAAPQAPSVTIVGADGATKTIVLPGGSAVLGGGTLVAPAGDEFAPGFAVGTTVTLMVLGIFALYRRFQRRGQKKAPDQLASDSSERLERLERGMEAIAIEIERISEGQRFVTNLLAESRTPAIPSKQV